MPSLFSSGGRPLLSRSRRPSFPSSRSPLVDSSLCHRRTPASVPTLASQTVSMARRRVVGRRRWTSTATRCTSATILMRRYRLHGADLLSLYWECMWEWILGWFMVKISPLTTQMFPPHWLGRVVTPQHERKDEITNCFLEFVSSLFGNSCNEICWPKKFIYCIQESENTRVQDSNLPPRFDLFATFHMTKKTKNLKIKRVMSRLTLMGLVFLLCVRVCTISG